METINVVLNDSEQTYKQTDDDDELALKVTMVPKVAAIDAPVADTSMNSFEYLKMKLSSSFVQGN